MTRIYLPETFRRFKPLMSKYERLPAHLQRRLDILIQAIDHELNFQIQAFFNKGATYTTEKKGKINAMKRARKMGAAVVKPFSKREIIDRDGLACYLCGELQTFESATLDHVLPLSRGGHHTPENVRIACKKCNEEKGSKTLSEYLAK